MPPVLRDDTTLATPSARGEVFHVCVGNQGTDLQLLWRGWLRVGPTRMPHQQPWLQQLHLPERPAPHMVCG